MARAAWLAAGGVAVALVATAVAAHPAALVAAAFGGAALAVLGLALGRGGLAWSAVGAAMVVARIGCAAFVSAPPQSLDEYRAGRWLAQVESISTPARNQQRAVLELRPVERIQASEATDSSGSGAANEAGLRESGAPLRVYATLPRYPVVAPGERFQFTGRVRPPPANSSFAAYLASKGIVATADVAAIEPIAPPGSPDAFVERLRRAAGDALARVLPEPQAGLAAGILIGLRDRVGRDVADAFTVSGLSHVVAISGWNIAIVGAVVSGLLRRRERRTRSLVVATAIGLYTIFAGASASVVRASLMAGTTLVARESGRRGAAAAALGLAAFGMLLLDPESVTDPGYQLSVAATAGLLRWSSPLGAALRERLPHLPDWLVESLAVSLAAQAATLPLVLFTFGRLSLIAPLANLVVAPLVAPAMLFGVVALLAGVAAGLGAPAALSVALGAPGSGVLGAIIWTADAAAAIPLASIELAEPWNLAAAAAASLLLIAASSSRLRDGVRRLLRRLLRERPRAASLNRPQRATARRGGAARAAAATLAIAAGLSILSLVVPAFTSAGGARLSMTVLDIGQGDAILLEGSRGGRILIDGGPDPDRLLEVLDARIPAWDRRIDLVVLTHPHEDHVAGLPLLLERYRIGGFAEPGMRGPGPGYRAFVREIRDGRRVDRTIAAGDQLHLDGADIAVRWPLRGKVPLEPPDDGTGINNVSIVLDLRYGTRRFLLTGDVEQQIDPQLLLNGIGERSVDVLKVPHHGSGTATTDALLAALRPRVAIVSAGLGNPYGHPSRRTLERIAAAGARVLRTDRDGSVTVSTDGTDLQISSTGARAAASVTTGAPAAASLAASSVPTLAGWSCGIAAAEPTVPTIPGWSRIANNPPPFFSPSGRPAGSSPTSARPPRWPASSRSASPAGETTTARSSKPPLSFTTSTSSFLRTGRSPAWSTVRPVLAG